MSQSACFQCLSLFAAWAASVFSAEGKMKVCILILTWFEQLIPTICSLPLVSPKEPLEGRPLHKQSGQVTTVFFSMHTVAAPEWWMLCRAAVRFFCSSTRANLPLPAAAAVEFRSCESLVPLELICSWSCYHHFKTQVLSLWAQERFPGSVLSYRNPHLCDRGKRKCHLNVILCMRLCVWLFFCLLVFPRVNTAHSFFSRGVDFSVNWNPLRPSWNPPRGGENFAVLVFCCFVLSLWWKGKRVWGKGGVGTVFRCRVSLKLTPGRSELLRCWLCVRERCLSLTMRF